MFVALMRDERLALRAVPCGGHMPPLLDRCGEEEYSGERARAAARTGHPPGVVSLPAGPCAARAGALSRPRPLPLRAYAARGPIAHTHGRLQGLGHFTPRAAELDFPLRPYAERRAGSAADRSPPASAVGYPPPERAAAPASVGGGMLRAGFSCALLAVALMAATFMRGAARAQWRRAAGR
ncbi:MAG: hypothetical protein AB1761_08060 [Pseudomonadota bacterium]